MTDLPRHLRLRGCPALSSMDTLAFSCLIYVNQLKQSCFLSAMPNSLTLPCVTPKL